MTSRDLSKGIVRAVIILLLIALAGYGIYMIRPLIAYIVISAVIALIGRPIVKFFHRKLKTPPTLAVACTILLLLIVNLGILSSFIPLLVAQGKNLSLLNIESLKESLNDITEQVFHYIDVGYDSEVLDISKYVSFNDVPDLINTLVGFLGDFGIGFFSVLFITFFFLKDGNRMMEALLELIPEKDIKNTRNSLNSIKSLLSRYFVGLIIQITVLFMIYTVTLLLVGVPNAAIIAVLCALLNLIPYLGPTISFFLIIILTMTGFIGEDFFEVILPKSIYVGIGFLSAQLLDNFVNQPLIFSNSVKSHPLEIFFVILAGGYLYGVVGMIIAIPVYTVIKVILKEFAGNNAVVQYLTKRL